MAAAEEVHEPVGGDGLRAEGGCPIEGRPLRFEQTLEPSERVVVKSLGGRQGWRGHNLSIDRRAGGVSPGEWPVIDEFLGQKVVIDLRSSFVCSGTLVRIDDSYLELKNADLHDLRDTHTTRENYVAASKATGIKRNRKRVLVVRSEVVAIARLDDVVAE